MCSLLTAVARATLLTAVLSACSCEERATKPADASIDHAAPDAPSEGAPSDALVYVPPDGPGRHCVPGTRRTIMPVKVEPYAEGGKPCGPGCKQVSFGNYVKLGYEFVGDTIVYVGDRSLVPGLAFPVHKVYYVDLKSGTEWRLHDESLHFGQGSGCKHVSAHGNTLGYFCSWDNDVGPGRWSLSFSRYDLATHQEVEEHCEARDTAREHCEPSGFSMGADGMAINMGLGACRDNEVLLHRYGTPGVTSLGSGPRKLARYVHMDGHYLAFTTVNPAAKNSLNVVLYDTRNGKQRFVDPHEGNQYWPRVGGNKVVWTDLRNQTTTTFPTHSDIYVYDIATGRAEPVTTHSARQEFADVGGDIVAWVDFRNDPDPNTDGNGTNWDIYFKDIATGKTHQLTSAPGYEAMPRVDGGRIVYRMQDARKDAALFVVDIKVWLATQK